MRRSSLDGCGLIVTGGTRGLGRAIVTLAVSRGAHVVYCGRQAPSSAREDRGRPDRIEGATFVATDVCSELDVDRLFESARDHLPGLDAVINNAAIALDRLLVEITLGEWNHVLSTNLRGPFLVASRAIREFGRARRRGAVVNISSVIANGSTGQAAYAASKSALLGLTEYWASTCRADGIWCNAIVPGFLRTDMTAALSDEGRRVREQLSPHRRSGRLEEVAEAALFLASDDASGFNGEALYVTGGIRDIPDIPG